MGSVLAEAGLGFLAGETLRRDIPVQLRIHGGHSFRVRPSEANLPRLVLALDPDLPSEMIVCLQQMLKRGTNTMADTGEDREIKQRANAHQKETVREMKELVQTANVRPAKSKLRSRSTSDPKAKQRIPRD